ncbi:helix-turn-helix domain-containing protein [Paracoccus sp. T5]|uniref:helix-turn-helix domain-containing protein n=1 Tax=Paracoccus sp. T5 TaxID=3402161 RepID=UPI003ADA8ED9
MSTYHYTESGLANVYIEGLVPFKDDDGDEVIHIPAINELHHAIAQGIVCHDKGMSPAELRFLRTEMGLTQTELAQMVHRDKQAVGRWERGEFPMDGVIETVVRRLAIERLELENVPGGIEKLAKSSVHSSEIQPININHSKGNYALAA